MSTVQLEPTPHLAFSSGVAGFACGNVYSLAKKHPDTIHPILQYSAAAGQYY